MSGSAAVRGRVIGSQVAILIGLAWWIWAVAPLPLLAGAQLGLLGLGAAAWLLRMSRIPSVTGGGAGGDGGRRRFPAVGFGLLLLAEVAGLNLLAWLLGPALLKIYLIPAISLVVGLHFIPMLWLFRRWELVACGVAMIAGAALAVAAISLGVGPPVAAGVEGAVNAVILWATAGYSLSRLQRAAAV